MKPIPLLEVVVGTTDGRSYVANFIQTHSTTKSIEYVRLILNFAAQSLVLTDSEEESYHQCEIQYLLERVARSEPGSIDTNSHCLLDDDWQPMEIEVREGRINTRMKRVVAVSGYVDASGRSLRIKTSRKWHHNQLFHSLIAIVELAVPRLSASDQAILIRACGKLASLYWFEADTRGSKEASRSFPNVSFLLAAAEVEKLARANLPLHPDGTV